MRYGYQSDPVMYARSSDAYGGQRDGNIFQQQQQPQQYYNQNNGFNNVQPRTRYERNADRQDDQYRNPVSVPQRAQYTPDQNSIKNLLHEPDQNTTLFQPEYMRFQKDFAAEERMNRENQRRLKEMKYEQRRMGTLERQGNIWQKEDEIMRKEEARRQFHEEQFRNGKRNANGLAYNPLTLQYADTDQGRQLKEQDENAQVRGFVRAQNLDQRSNCGYNLITGTTRTGVETVVPQHLTDQFSTKVKQKDQYYDIKYYALQQQLLNQQGGY